MASDTRDRILDALRAVLARDGSTGVTLESVAAEAGVSKGGLLYHFRSKEALYQGLLERTLGLVRPTIAEMTATSGPVRAFLDYSVPAHDDEGEFMTALIAAVRAGHGTGPAAADLLVQIFDACDAPMLAAVADPVQAQVVRLVGLGMYLSAIAGLPLPPTDVLDAVCDRLVAQTPTAAGSPVGSAEDQE